MHFRVFAVAAATTLSTLCASAANIVELWDQVPAPPAPKLASVSVTANDTALLLLDIIVEHIRDEAPLGVELF